MKKENIVLPLEKVVKAVENKKIPQNKRFPIHNIFCEFKDYQDFWSRIIQSAFDKLVKDGKITPIRVMLSGEPAETAYVVWTQAKKDEGVELDSRELWERLVQLYGEAEVREIPDKQHLGIWIPRYFKKGKLPGKLKYPGIGQVSKHVGEELKYSERIISQNLKNKRPMSLNIVLYLAHEICEWELELIENNINNMDRGGTAKPGVIKILKVLFDSEKALSAEEISREARKKISRDYLICSLKPTKYLSSKMFPDGESRFTIRGEEFKFEKV